MGRELRSVPMGWAHPKEQAPNWLTGIMEEHYRPLYDRDLETAMDDWLEEYERWKASELAATIQEHPNYGYSVDEPYRSFCDYNGAPPDPDRYRPRWADDAVMGYAIYETVSEGTPVTPTFATKEELIAYLTANGDFWDQSRGDGPYSQKAAENLVNGGWAPSLIVIDGQVMSGVEGLAALPDVSKTE